MTDPRYLNTYIPPKHTPQSLGEADMLKPHVPSPEEELTRLLALGTAEACEALVGVCGRIQWDMNKPWYYSKIYDLVALNSKIDNADLTRVLCKVVKANPDMKDPLSEVLFSDSMTERFIRNECQQSILVCFQVLPNLLPGEQALHLLAESSSKKFEPLRLFVENRLALEQAGEMFPAEHAAALMMGALESENMNVLKCVFPLTSKTRKERSMALSVAVNKGFEKAVRYLVKTASVCEALMVPKNRLDTESLTSEYDKLADLMQEEDVLATDYILGDEFNLPAIRARAQQIRMRATVQPTQKARPGPRL